MFEIERKVLTPNRETELDPWDLGLQNTALDGCLVPKKGCSYLGVTILLSVIFLAKTAMMPFVD
jgi:hypothetical protein